MKKLIVLGVLAIFLMLSITPGINANTITTEKNKDKQNYISKTAVNFPVNVAEWNIGNSWTYDMNLGFEALDEGEGTTLKVNGRVPSMYCKVEEIKCVDGEEVYVLSISGLFTGTVNLLGILDIGTLDNINFGGEAYFNANKLAPQSFSFDLKGILKTPLGDMNFHFTLDISFEPSFDFFNFPINEDESSWSTQTFASLTAYVKIKLLGIFDYETTYGPENMDFDDTLENKGITDVNVGAGSFQAVELSGLYGEPSELYYAPDIGFLAKVYEELIWGDGGILAIFDLELKNTNYIVGNNPPEKPTTPNGPSSGDIGHSYSYESKAADPEGHQVYYWFDWGDGFNSGWLGPYASGSGKTVSHTWTQKGMYNVVVKAKDESGIESVSSAPLTVSIGYDQPCITLVMNRIRQKDGIDVVYPWDPNPPELYYKIIAESDDFTVTASNHNTKNGEYSDTESNWVAEEDWTDINKEHELSVESREVVLKIKVMDFDPGNGDDLADVSGCNYPDNEGVNDDTPNKRGAIFHSTYDMGSTDTYALSPYSNDHNDYSDYWEINNGYYSVAGDDTPDSTTGDEPPLSAENDARVWFAIYDNYDLPEVNADVVNLPRNLRPGNTVGFTGIVKEGAAPFTWDWSFGDGQTSNEQNPTHSYSSPGDYTVTLELIDRLGQIRSESFEIKVYKNQAPEELTIVGTESGSSGTAYTYRFYAIDPEQDELSYKISWGDGTTSGWIDELSSGEEIIQDHVWTGERDYVITFTVKDGYGAESSESTTVSMPRQRTLSNSYLLRFLGRFPMLKQILLEL